MHIWTHVTLLNACFPTCYTQEPKRPGSWKIKAQRSNIKRQSKIVPHFKKVKEPLIGNNTKFWICFLFLFTY